MVRKNMHKIISVNGVSITINKKDILNNINLEIYDEGISVITGHNGAGKSTLLKIMAKILYPTEGNVSYNRDITHLASSFIFQKPIFLNRTVKDNLLYALKNSKEKSNNESLIMEQLAKFDLSHLYNCPAKKLSSGEQQLIAFIRSIIIKPLILFLDEPTSSLDKKNKTLVNHMLLNLSESIKIIVTSQSMEQTKLFTDKPLVMQNGMLI